MVRFRNRSLSFAVYADWTVRFDACTMGQFQEGVKTEPYSAVHKFSVPTANTSIEATRMVCDRCLFALATTCGSMASYPRQHERR